MPCARQQLRALPCPLSRQARLIRLHALTCNGTLFLRVCCMCALLYLLNYHNTCITLLPLLLLTVYPAGRSLMTGISCCKPQTLFTKTTSRLGLKQQRKIGGSSSRRRSNSGCRSRNHGGGGGNNGLWCQQQRLFRCSSIATSWLQTAWTV